MFTPIVYKLPNGQITESYEEHHNAWIDTADKLEKRFPNWKATYNPAYMYFQLTNRGDYPLNEFKLTLDTKTVLNLLAITKELDYKELRWNSELEAWI